MQNVRPGVLRGISWHFGYCSATSTCLCCRRSLFPIPLPLFVGQCLHSLALCLETLATRASEVERSQHPDSPHGDGRILPALSAGPWSEQGSPPPLSSSTYSSRTPYRAFCADQRGQKDKPVSCSSSSRSLSHPWVDIES